MIYQDVVGSPERHAGSRLSTLSEMPGELRETLCDQLGDFQLSPPQEQALDCGLLNDDLNLLVSAATNSGKTLIAVMRMFAFALKHGARSVFVVPLKAIAEEKLIEFEAIAHALNERSDRAIKVTITTGDYQQTEDFLGSPPPGKGEIVICTPERLEVMLRNPDSHSWARGIHTFVFDEFHLLGERKRGATLESLLTRVLVTCPTSSIVALSATIGNSDQLATWFQNNDRQLMIIENDYRFPKLHRSVILAESKDDFVKRHAQQVIQTNEESMLVFVDTKATAERIARQIGDWTNTDAVTFFHAGLSLSQKRRRMAAIASGKIMIVVTTTSLKMGVNFPVSRVIVRDYKLHDGSHRKKLTISDVLQMMGRAGRREQPGEAFLLADTRDDAQEYGKRIAANEIAPLKPQLLSLKKSDWRSETSDTQVPNPISSLVLTELAIRGEGQRDDVWRFASKSYSAVFLDQECIDFAGSFTALERSKLIYRVEGSDQLYAVTKLGRTIARSGLSPESGAILAGFLRALITMSEKPDSNGQQKSYIRSLTSIDLLFLSLCCYELRDSWVSKPSKKAIEQTQQYIECLDVNEKPLVNRWRSAESKEFPTRRLLSTLKLQVEECKQQQVFYQILRTAELLHRHAKGEKLSTLSAEYAIAVGKIENRLVATAMWVLSCLGQICDPEKAYRLHPISLKAFDVLRDLSVGCELGTLLGLKGIGRRSIDRILETGILSLDELTREKLKLAKLESKKIEVIRSFLARRGR